MCELLPPLASLSRLFVLPWFFSILPLHRRAYAAGKVFCCKVLMPLKEHDRLDLSLLHKLSANVSFADSTMQFPLGQSMLLLTCPQGLPCGPPTKAVSLSTD